MVNWAQIHNHSLAATLCRGLADRTNFREKPQAEWPASCTVFLPAEPNLRREFLESYFNQWADTCPNQSELHRYFLICIFTYQSGSICQPGGPNLTNQDSTT